MPNCGVYSLAACTSSTDWASNYCPLYCGLCTGDLQLHVNDNYFEKYLDYKLQHPLVLLGVYGIVLRDVQLTSNR